MRWIGRLSVRTKLVGLILLVMLPLFLMQTVHVLSQLKSVSRVELERGERAAWAAMDDFDNYVNSLWTHQYAVGTALATGGYDSPTEIEQFLSLQQASDESISWMSWVAPNGDVIASTHPGGRGMNVGTREHMARVLQGEKRSMSSLMTCRMSDSPCVAAVQRIELNEQLVGVITTVVELTAFDQVLAGARPEGAYTLIDPSGALVYRNDPTRGALDVGERFTAYDMAEITPGGTFLSETFPGADGESQLAAAVCSPVSNWRVWYAVPTAEALAGPHQDARNSFGLLVLLTGLSIGGALVLSRGLLRPVEQLHHTAQAVAGGARDARAQVTARDELGEAIAAFDRMLEQLEQQEEVTRREAAEIQRRLTFLAEAGAELVSSLDYQVTLDHIAHLAVPAIADSCVIRLKDRSGEFGMVTLVHNIPQTEEWVRSLHSRYHSDHPPYRWSWRHVVDTGEPAFFPEVTPEIIAQFSVDEEHRREMERAEFTSVMVVPMMAPQGVIGTITFVSAESGRHFEERDLQLALELARYAAMAVERARAYEDVQTALSLRDVALAQAHMAVRHQEVVAELGRKALSVTGDPVTFMTEAVTMLARELDVEYTTVLERLPGRKALVMRAGYGWEPHLYGNMVITQEPFTQAGYTLLMDEPVVVRDLSREDRFVVPELLRAQGAVSGVTIAIRSAQQVAYGVLAVHATRAKEFSSDEIHFLQAVANLMGAAITRWRMEAALQEEEAIVSGQARVLEQIAMGRSLQTILEAIIHFVEERIAHSRCAIVLIEQTTVRWVGGQRLRRDDEMGLWDDLKGPDTVGPSGPGIPRSQVAATASDEVGEAPWMLDPDAKLPRGIGPWWTRRIFGADGTVVGALHLYSDIGREPLSEELEVLDVSVSLMGVAIEQKRLEEGRNQKLEYLVRHMGEGVVAIDEEGRVLTISPSLHELFAETLKMRPEGLAVEEVGLPKELVDALRQSIRPGDHPQERFMLKFRESELQVHVQGVQPALGLPVGAIALLRDVTREKRLQRLEQSLIANVSHELRGPLATLSATAEAMYDGLITDEMRPKYLKAMVDEMGRLRRLTSDLLELSRLEAGTVELHMEMVDVSALLTGLQAKWSQRCSRAGLSLVVECGHLLVRTDYDRLEQIVSNFLENAVRHTRSEGRVGLVGEIENGGVRIRVSDTGEGIPREHLNRIWDRFYKVDSARTLRADRGSGLGLAIAKQLAERLHGQLGVESEAGKGSTFSIWLPNP